MKFLLSVVVIMSLRMAIDAVDAAVRLLRNDAARGDRALHHMFLELTDEVRALRTNVLVLGGQVARLQQEMAAHKHSISGRNLSHDESVPRPAVTIDGRDVAHHHSPRQQGARHPLQYDPDERLPLRR